MAQVLARPAPSSAVPPGPKGHWFAGNFRAFRADPFAYVTRCAAEYGDIVAIRLGPTRRFYLLNHPDLIEEVLVTKSRHFIKHFALRQNGSLLGKGLLTSEGEFWLRQRKLLQPTFARQRLAEYAATMVEQAARLRDGWTDGERREFRAEMNRVTLNIAARTFFGTEADDQADTVRRALDESLDCFNRRMQSLIKIPLFIPSPNNVRLRRAGRALDSVLYGMIRQRRDEIAANPERARAGDLLALLLQARDEDDGTRMTDRQVRDEAMTLFLAGHETTALGLAWTWYLLGKHPAVEARVLAEVDAVLGGPAGRLPTADDLPGLKFTEQVILESMRVYPPVYLIGREAVTETTVGGYRVPKGMTMWMWEWVVHHDARWFDRPDEFIPDRWAGDFAQRLPRYAYFPFGGGPRVCIGNAFAMMELVLVMATLLQKFRAHLAPGLVVTPSPSFTLRPEQDMTMTLEQR